jgi:hypothetical protein
MAADVETVISVRIHRKVAGTLIFCLLMMKDLICRFESADSQATVVSRFAVLTRRNQSSQRI